MWLKKGNLKDQYQQGLLFALSLCKIPKALAVVQGKRPNIFQSPVMPFTPRKCLQFPKEDSSVL